MDRVIAEGVSLLTTNARGDPRLVGSASIALSAIRIALCAPLRSGDAVVGALYVDSAEPHVDGPAGGRLPTAEDLTLLESVASYAALALSRARAHEALRQRELHAHLLVHDLKNPVSNILGASELVGMLIPGGGNDEVREILSLITSAGRRLDGYISDILNVAHLEEAGLRPKRELHALADVGRAIAARWESALTLRRLRLEVQVSPDRASASFDAHLIDRVIDNLLDNATQHAPSDSALGISMVLDGDGILRVHVRDRGPGVPEAMRVRIFDKFARVKDKHVGGRGFGLYFCRLAVEAHGGEIAVAGEPGDNAFVFSIPPAAEDA